MTETASGKQGPFTGAYARLWGRNGDVDFGAFITHLPTHLGRSSHNQANTKPGFVGLGEAKAFSRHHATIDWDQDSKCYYIMCHSKNGMTVANKHRGQGGREVLSSRTPVKLGPLTVYFLLPDDLNRAATGGAGTAPYASMLAPRDTTVVRSQMGGPAKPLDKSSGPTKPAPPAEVAQAVAQSAGEEPPKTPAAADRGQQAPGSSAGKPGGSSLKRKAIPDADRAPPPREGPVNAVPYSQLIKDAWQSEGLRHSIESYGGLTSQEIQQYVFSRFPELGDASRKKAAANGIQNALGRNYSKLPFTEGEISRKNAVSGGATAYRGCRWIPNSDGPAPKKPKVATPAHQATMVPAPPIAAPSPPLTAAYPPAAASAAPSAVTMPPPMAATAGPVAVTAPAAAWPSTATFTGAAAASPMPSTAGIPPAVVGGSQSAASAASAAQHMAPAGHESVGAAGTAAVPAAHTAPGTAGVGAAAVLAGGGVRQPAAAAVLEAVAGAPLAAALSSAVAMAYPPVGGGAARTMAGPGAPSAVEVPAGAAINGTPSSAASEPMVMDQPPQQSALAGGNSLQ